MDIGFVIRFVKGVAPGFVLENGWVSEVASPCL